MVLDNIKQQTTWSDASASINSNNQKIVNELNRLSIATYKNKGYFTDIDSLKDAFPVASIGSRAYVGRSYPYEVWLWNGSSSSWENSGDVGGEENVELNDFYTKSETMEAIEGYHVVLSQDEYDALEEKKDKLYFTYEE